MALTEYDKETGAVSRISGSFPVYFYAMIAQFLHSKGHASVVYSPLRIFIIQNILQSFFKGIKRTPLKCNNLNPNAHFKPCIQLNSTFLAHKFMFYFSKEYQLLRGISVRGKKMISQ